MRIKDYIPKLGKPQNRKFNCPIEDEINVSQYRVLVDRDIENGQVYLNLGYDDMVEYDSSFFLSYKDARELGKLLMDAADESYRGRAILDAGKKEVESLVTDLKAHNVFKLNITPISLYCEDPEDSFFGSMIILIEYSLKDDTNKLNKFMVISDNFGSNDKTKYDNVVDTLTNEYKVPHASFDIKKFKYLVSKIIRIYRQYIVVNKPVETSSKMTPKDRQDIATMAKQIMNKINSENSSS